MSTTSIGQPDLKNAELKEQELKHATQQEVARLSREYPTAEDVPGCTGLFDTYLLCHVMNSQIKSLYRYGHVADCARKMDDFKFCMGLKGLHPEQKRDAWIQRKAEWWAARRVERSSEDVWEMRTEPLQDYPPPLTGPVQSNTLLD